MDLLGLHATISVPPHVSNLVDKTYNALKASLSPEQLNLLLDYEEAMQRDIVARIESAHGLLTNGRPG